VTTTYIQTPVNIPKIEIYAPAQLVNFCLFAIIIILIGAIISQHSSNKKKVKKWRKRAKEARKGVWE
jgi:threonine aldolase